MAGLVERIWARDASVWGPGEDDPAQRLGWLTLPTDMRGEIPRLHRLAQAAVEEGIEHVVLLGMGGSSLAPEVFSARARGTSRSSRSRRHGFDAPGSGTSDTREMLQLEKNLVHRLEQVGRHRRDDVPVSVLQGADR